MVSQGGIAMTKWPDEKLEATMLRDAEFIESGLFLRSTVKDCACHIKALMARVRELEALNEQQAIEHSEEMHRMNDPHEDLLPPSGKDDEFRADYKSEDDDE